MVTGHGMRFKASLGFLIMMSGLCSCVNPLVSIESEIKQFKSSHPDKIKTFVGKNKTMGYAFSGNSSKRAVLFVHGSPGSWEGWVHFLRDPQLQKDFHLIAIDRPGYGQSMPGKTETSVAQQASDIVEVLKLNSSGLPAFLVGHSYGGPVVAKMAMDFPDRVAGIVFAASSVNPDLEKTKWFQYPASWWPIRNLIPTNLRVCNEEITPLRSELIQMLPFWKNIRSFSVLIQGEQDELVPSKNLDFLIEHLDKKTVLKVRRVPELNHFIPWKRPDLIVDGINELNNAISKVNE